MDVKKLFFIRNKGKLAWEYIAAFIIALLVLVLMLIFSNYIKEKALHGLKFLLKLFGR